MRRITLGRSLALALSALRISVASAGDAPYSSGSLPFLETHSSLVVKTAPEGIVSRGDGVGVRFYSAPVAEVLKGKPAGDRSVLVAVRREEGEGEPAVGELSAAILFLRGPLEGGEARSLGAPAGEPVYRVISSMGIIPDRGERGSAVRDFLKLKHPTTAPNSHLAWADRFVTSDDPLLQRSAIFEVLKHASDNPLAVSVCDKALDSKTVSLANKSVAIEALQSSQLPSAIASLKDFAMEDSTPQDWKNSALVAIAATPGGRNALSDLSFRDDLLIAPMARQVLERARGTPEKIKTPPTEQQLRRVNELLNSSDADDRLKGLNALKGLGYSRDLLRSVDQLLKNKSAGVADKRRAIDILSRTFSSSQEVANFLENLGASKDYPTEVRKSALAGLRELETGIGLGAIERLITKLNDPNDKEIQDMARFLAVQ